MPGKLDSWMVYSIGRLNGFNRGSPNTPDTEEKTELIHFGLANVQESGHHLAGEQLYGQQISHQPTE